ncbi:sterol desaturase family protein [Pedobacter caeni]|uniref:Sterol desaturase/sphingolipid hydroxylase, fatty acid hydroxylase superfamily n=1 Tax=Pedobacter caeni TaxID=288992 RepID=A0A1M5L8W9_9SPHI|nr:sterol desaturase family protein [Pedobacter caeni]SHG61532.1 Sterol desaturase/sphingolipid hydroxylase, fatty acid hydroxylase superfamily [Pedobacter caeni]
MDVNEGLTYLLELPAIYLWPVFLLENVLITLMVLWLGRLIQRHYAPEMMPAYSYTPREWWICGITNILNTVITYLGYWLWKHGFILISTDLSLLILSDILILFLAMDLLMYVFHYIIHKTWLYKAIHGLHHESTDPKPIDLFVLHPLETIGFGSLWLLLLCAVSFNIYAIVVYLVINVLFGMTGHLGMEPLSVKLRNKPILKYLGTSSFHHDHHQDITRNFGFYTSIWDRLFGTYKPMSKPGFTGTKHPH